MDDNSSKGEAGETTTLSEIAAPNPILNFSGMDVNNVDGSVSRTGLSHGSNSGIEQPSEEVDENYMSHGLEVEDNKTKMDVDSVSDASLWGKGKRTKKQPERYNGTTQGTEIAKCGTSGGSSNADRREIGLHNSNANLCYVNSMMRMLFYATDGSLERLLKTIPVIQVCSPLNRFMQQLSSLWEFLRLGEKNTFSYPMNDYLTAFKALYAHRGTAERNWDTQQDAEEFLNVFFLLLFNDRMESSVAHDEDGFHGIQEINVFTYTQCSKCSQTQQKGKTICTHHVVVITPDDGTNIRVSFKDLLESTMQGTIDYQSEQQCSPCVEQMKKKISSDNEVSDSTKTSKQRIHEALEELGYTRSMTHKMCWKIREYQDYILVFVKKQPGKGGNKGTRKRHFLLPIGAFEIKENGIWKVWAVLLYTGQGHGTTAGGHYYVIDTKGKYDDQHVHYDENLLSTLSSTGYHRDTGTEGIGNGYIEMVLLKRTVSDGDGSVCGEISRYMYITAM